MSKRILFIIVTFIIFSSNSYAACSKLLDEIILKVTDSNSITYPHPNLQWQNYLAKKIGMPIRAVSPMPSGAYLVKIDSDKLAKLARQNNFDKEKFFTKKLAELRKQPDVVYADRNGTLCMLKPVPPQTSLLPIKAKYKSPNVLISHASQWDHFEYPGIFLQSSPGTVDDGAWSISKGSPSIVLSNFEPINPNPDLDPNVLTGWNFATNTTNVADPRDNHGTHVAGTMLASGTASAHISGVGPNMKLLPIVIFTIDQLEAGLYWSAQKPVVGVPENTHPVKVINMSFGYDQIQGCQPSLQEAIDVYLATNGVIFAAAGNDNIPVTGTPPTVCKDVVTVASTQRTGVRAYYSNYGPDVTFAAPGGEITASTCDPNGILSTVETGTGCVQSGVGTGYEFYQGTSMASPQVSGIAGLIYTVLANDPNLNGQKVRNILLESVQPFGASVDPDRTCMGEKSCGTGIVNALTALQIATNGNVYVIAAPSPTDLNLDRLFDFANYCPDNKLVAKAAVINSSVPQIPWRVLQKSRKCQPIDVYESPSVSMVGTTLTVAYGTTQFTMPTPPGVTCSVLNSHGFECR